MSLSLTYDATLSRVRLTAVSYLNANPFFEVDVSNWTPTNGTFVRSTTQFHQGIASGLLTPNGVGATAEVNCETAVAVAGGTYRASVWVRCAVARNVRLTLDWIGAGQVSQTVAVAANTWTQLSVTEVAPAGTTGARMFVSLDSTPPSSHTLHIDEAMIEPSPVVAQRSTNQITWTTVRGGTDLPTGAVALDDYEFVDAVANYYRVAGQTANITPVLDGVWLKSLARPFLNRKVRVTDWSDVERASRSGVFPIVGRSLPVVVTDLHGSRQWTLDVVTQDAQDANNLDLLISTGEVQFVHVPAAERIPGGYVALGDTSQRRPQPRSQRRIFSLPLTECAPPGPDVVPAVGTCQTVFNTYASCSAVLIAHPTCADLLQLVGSPADVIVP